MSDRMRSEFEKWHMERYGGFGLGRSTEPGYTDEYERVGTNLQWVAWQAAQSVPKDKPTECANGCPEKQVCDYCQSMYAALRLIAVNREVVELQERIRQLESQSVPVVGEASLEIFASRCPMCSYQHGHQIGCENNPIDIALRASAAAPKKEVKK